MLTNRLAREGDWLFRRRSFVPLLFVPVVCWSLLHFDHYVWSSHTAQHAWGTVCCLLSWLGLLLRVTTVGFVPGGTSGRNTVAQRATELNTSGWYSLTRNPLYLGNCIIGLGMAAAPGDLELVICYLSVFIVYYERIIAREEEFLLERFGDRYCDWARQTPAFLPRSIRMIAPVYSWCWRTVLRREYSAVFLIGLAFFAIDLFEHWQVDHRLYLDPSWTLHFAGCAVFYGACRILKKKTKLLCVAGR